MKKTSLIFLCVLLSVFGFSGVSYSHFFYDFIVDTRGEELHKNGNMMISNNNDLLQIMKTISTDDTKFWIHMCLYEECVGIQMTIFWSLDLLHLLTCEKNKETLQYVKKRLLENRNHIKNRQDIINRIYGLITIVSVLHIVDKQREIIRLSLKLLDETQKLLKIDVKEMEKKQSKTKSK